MSCSSRKKAAILPAWRGCNAPRFPTEALRHAIEENAKIVRPLDDSYFDFLATRYSYLWQFAPAFLAAFAFQSNVTRDPLLARVDPLLAQKGKARMEEGKLVVSPLEAEERPESAIELERQIDERLPLVDLSELLVEVDSWTHFTLQAFLQAGAVQGGKPPPDLSGFLPWTMSADRHHQSQPLPVPLPNLGREPPAPSRPRVPDTS